MILWTSKVLMAVAMTRSLPTTQKDGDGSSDYVCCVVTLLMVSWRRAKNLSWHLLPRNQLPRNALLVPLNLIGMMSQMSNHQRHLETSQHRPTSRHWLPIAEIARIVPYVNDVWNSSKRASSDTTTNSCDKNLGVRTPQTISVATVDWLSWMFISSFDQCSWFTLL